MTRDAILYILFIVFGIVIFVPAFAIALCASALVVLAEKLLTTELLHIINGRSSN